MYTYFSTFITGLSSVIESEIKHIIKDVAIESIQDGLIIYSTNCPYTDKLSIRFFNNTFLLLKTFKSDDWNKKNINNMISDTINERNLFDNYSRTILLKNNTFRIVISKENQMIPVGKRNISILENKIQHEVHLSVHKTLPDIELWFVIRRGSEAYFGIRLTKTHTEYSKILRKGELRPELSHLLCYISEPSEKRIYSSIRLLDLDQYLSKGQ